MFLMIPLDFYLFILPLFVMSLLGFMPNGMVRAMRRISLIFSLFVLVMSFAAWFHFVWFNGESFITYNVFFRTPYTHGLLIKNDFNAVSVTFILLTSFLTVIAVLISWNWLPKYYSVRTFLILIILIEWISFRFFTSCNLLYFYMFFEAVLIPMYFLLGIWGMRPRKVHAAYQFFLYTFTGSLFMLMSILYLNNKTCGSGFCEIFSLEIRHVYLATTELLTAFESRFIWLGFFIAFAIKIPMVPVHIWLPEAHVEAPTAGSVILAGLLLKYGTYGFFRILSMAMSEVTNYYFWLICVLSLISILYGSLITYIQTDFKKIIAYSSVSHMGYVTLGLAVQSPEGVVGALLIMVTHGFISSGLFYIVGILYERYGTRNIYSYGGLKAVMPRFTFYFFLLTLANLNLPLTAGFVSEFMVLMSLGYLESKLILLLAAIGVFTNGIYSIWLFNRLCFGNNLICQKNASIQYVDLDKRERIILSTLCFIIFFFGIFPHTLIISFEDVVVNQLIDLNMETILS